MLIKLLLHIQLCRHILLHQIKVEGTTAGQGVVVADGIFVVVDNLENNHGITTTKSSMLLLLFTYKKTPVIVAMVNGY